MIFKKAFIALDSNRVMLVQSFIEITLLKVSFLLWLVIQEFRFFSLTSEHSVCVNSLTPAFICTAISDTIMCGSPYTCIYDERSVGSAIVP